ncbi:MAG: LysR family transcriptional regulator [Myxococcota bacterium]
MPSTDRLIELVAITDAGSIARAAELLDIPRATLSRRLKALEQELGVRLINREARHFGLTPAGERLVEQARSVLAATEAAWRSVELSDEPAGELRLSIPPTHILKDLLVDFGKAYPEVRLRVRATSRLLDMHSESVDLAMRFGPVGDESLTVRLLNAGRAVLVAAPSYVQRMGRPTSPEELAEHRCLVRFDADWRPRRYWPLVGGGRVEVNAHLATNELLLRLEAALQGQGITMLPVSLVADYVEAGQLEPVLVEAVAEPVSVNLVYSSRRLLPPQARAFIDFTVARSAQGLLVDPRVLPRVAGHEHGE